VVDREERRVVTDAPISFPITVNKQILQKHEETNHHHYHRDNCGIMQEHKVCKLRCLQNTLQTCKSR
jgi:hypothetical protein